MAADDCGGVRRPVKAPKGRLAGLSRWGLAVVAFAFVAWIVPVRDRCFDPAGLHCEPGIASTIARARPGMLAPLLLLYFLSSLAWAARWRALLTFTGIELPLFRVWRLSIEAQAGGILLPGGIGGDALRIASVARPSRPGAERPPLSVVIASVIVDRLVGLAVVCATAATLAFASDGLLAGPLPGVLAAVPIALVSGVVVMRRAPARVVRWLTGGRVGRIASPLLEYARDPRAPRALVVAASLSVLVAGAQFITVRGLVFALGGVPTVEKWVYVGTAMAFVVSALPGVPGAWGTAEATYIFFFGFAGLHPGTAVAVCLLYRLFWYASGLVGAILYIARPRESTVSGEAGRGGPGAKPYR